MLLKNYIVITDTDSKEVLQNKLGLSFFFFSLRMEIIFHCPSTEKIAGRILDEKCSIRAAVVLHFSGAQSYSTPDPAGL